MARLGSRAILASSLRLRALRFLVLILAGVRSLLSSEVALGDIPSSMLTSEVTIGVTGSGGVGGGVGDLGLICHVILGIVRVTLVPLGRFLGFRVESRSDIVVHGVSISHEVQLIVFWG